MDYVKLVKDGTYKKEDLSSEHQRIIEGMYHIKTSLFDNKFIDESELESLSPSLTKLQLEIADNVISCMREYAELIICDAIVSFALSEAAQNGDEPDQMIFKRTSDDIVICSEQSEVS